MQRLERLVLPLATLIAFGCGGGGDSDGGARDGSTRIDAALDAAASDASAIDGGVDAGIDTGGLVPVDPPPPPVFGDVVDTISIAVRTGDGASAGTDDPIELCVNATTCFDLDTPDIDDRQVGLTDALHFSGLALPRSDIDRVTLRTRSPLTTDNDRWTPVCLELRFDGEPVYCNDAIGKHIGTGASTDEVPSWTDPAGLHEACTTCWPQTLTHGPVQGAHDTDTARVWVRADATRPVALRMSAGALDDGSPIVAWALPSPRDDFTAVLTVDGLDAGRTYRYRVEVDGDRSQPIRELSTAPTPDDSRPLRFAFGSCTRERDQPAFAPLLAADPDLFLFLGDAHYANSRHQEAHRWSYRLFRAIPERAAFLAEVPSVAVWDDHDFVGNNATGTCAGREEGLRAFEEYWANPGAGTPDAPGVFFHHRWGAIELFALDCRMYRPDVGDPNRRCDDDPSPPTLSIADGPIGGPQEAWLLDALSSSDATFKLVGCGSQLTLEGTLDSWRSFPAARDALFDAFAARGVEGVVLLSGDIHRSEVRLISRPSSYDIPELTSSPLANGPSTCPADTAERAFCYDAAPSYLVVDVDPTVADPTLTVRVYDDTGAMRFEQTILRSALQP